MTKSVLTAARPLIRPLANFIFVVGVMASIVSCLGIGAYQAYRGHQQHERRRASLAAGRRATWEAARQVSESGNLELLIIPTLSGVVHFEGQELNCPMTHSDLIWKTNPPSGNPIPLTIRVNKASQAPQFFACSERCTKGGNRVFAFNLVEMEPGDLKERLSRRQWESLPEYVKVGTDQEVSWYFQTLIQNLSEGELALEREYRQRMGIAPLVEADEPQ